MLLPIQLNYWSKILNLIMQNYLLESATICLVWNPNLHFDILTEKLTDKASENQLVLITLNDYSDYLQSNTYDFDQKRKELNSRGLVYDDLVMKFIVSIEASFCETFVAFQDEIAEVVRAFTAGNLYADWHSKRNRFLFAYHKDKLNISSDFFNNRFFEVQSDILIVEAETLHSSNFSLKTNKYVGPIHENPGLLYTLNIYNAVNDSFAWSSVDLFLFKKRHLDGKEVIFASPYYAPYAVYKRDLQPQVPDHNEKNPNGTIFVDGTEARPLFDFCWLHNCSIHFDSSKEDDWGSTYSNGSGSGCIGLAVQDRAMLSFGGDFQWHFKYVDQSGFLARSGTTCLVPAPARLTSWALPLRPFQLTLWFGVILCLSIESIALLFVRQTEQRLELGEDFLNWQQSFKFSYATTLKLFISQSSTYEVTGTSLRVLLFSCYMIDIIMTSLYGGGLAAIITIPTLDEAPDSIDRMIKYNLKWTGQSEDWIEALTHAEDIRSKKLLSNFYLSTVEEITRDAETEFRGFILEYQTFGHFANIDHLSLKAINRLKLLEEDLYTQFTVSFMARDWALQEEYTKFLHWYHSAGFAEHWEWIIAERFTNTYYQRRVKASKHPIIENDPVELDIANFFGLLLVWILGMSISILTFALEIYLHRRLNSKPN